LFYAHTKGKDITDWQSLRDHLINSAEIARLVSEDKFLESLTYPTALLHDIGKYSQAFQNRLHGSNKLVDHSTAGAQMVYKLAGDNKQKQFIAQLIGFCVAGHHSGLPNYGSNADHSTEPTLLARLKRNIEDYSNFQSDFPELIIDFPTTLQIKPTRKGGQFSVAFLVRMIYSILVDSDFLETEAFFRGKIIRGDYPTIKNIEKVYSNFLINFDNPQSEINRKRTELLKTCIQKATADQGLFSLTIPTGGGKTYSSMAFALAHAKHHGLNRVIYCIPFTTIIEQTAQVFRECLGTGNILEHHSNFDWRTFNGNGQNDPTSNKVLTNTIVRKLKLSSENWDIPIVITTNIQFFESLFSNRSSRCRKIHSLRRSVIIFDEAQMLPRDYLEPCMMSLAELITNYQTSVVLCTATQPPLEIFFPAYIQQREIISLPADEYAHFKRVNVKNIGRKNDEEISTLINSYKKVLCIVNTRKHAKGLFEMVNEVNRYHLSTLMCPAHRKEVVSQIRNQLITGSSCRVISTQIMEAGIDLDFPVGFRALAGLDSIVQSAGRINRENKRSSGTLHVFETDSAFVKHIPTYIRQTADIARIIMDKYEDPISIEALKAYYQLLYEIQDPNAFDQKKIMSCFQKGIFDEPNFDFAIASERFKLIENETVSVVIPWNDFVVEEINKIRYSEFTTSFLRSLQPYSVNIYPNEFSILLNSGKIEIINDRFPVLVEMGEDIYHPDTGLIIPDNKSGEAIIF